LRIGADGVPQVGTPVGLRKLAPSAFSRFETMTSPPLVLIASVSP
jgi:hypothetical protein